MNRFTLLVLALVSLPASAQDIRFDRDIRPLLSRSCYECHGPDGHERQGDLRLDQPDGAEGALRTHRGETAILPGHPDKSTVWHRITTDDPDALMPPPESNKPPLSAEEKALIEAWIAQGAPYEDFWAFVPPKEPAPPKVSDPSWSAQPIDRFVLRTLDRQALQPSPLADKRTLIRRVTFDLTGLPPTREEIAAFLADDSPQAYEHLVDRLLKSPAYGEHMTKYWLDLVRFADTNGIHHDHYREMTPYRDWVIRAFNENLPYSDFVRDQLAGDLHPNPTRDQLIASGFHRLHLIIDVGTALPEESHVRNVIDRVTAVGTAFMGLTVQCAVCHDHKYDPLTMKDFYQLYAFFNNIDATPETGRRSGTDFRRGLQSPYINLTTEAEAATLEQLQKALAAAKAEGEKSAPFKEAQQAHDDFLLSLPAAMVMKEREDPRPAHLLIRGAYDAPGEEVTRGTPGFLPPLTDAPKEGLASRMDLANWFLRSDHPLTARVAVNRIWQQFFGVGLVKTSEDFGAQGEWPSHPDLLDHLAVSFMASGWDVKDLVKRIVLTETYQQSADADPEAFAKDPENRHLARGARFRMDSEMIRDQILATSGLLHRELYGKSVKPPQPAGLWRAVGMPSSYPKAFVADEGDRIYRRSVYTFWKRGMPPPQMTILNAPTREACTARRERTNTPLQALLLLNESEYLRAARHLAHASLTESPSLRTEQRIAWLYETITSHLPDAKETKALHEAFEELKTLYAATPELAIDLCEGVDTKDASRLAAWTMVTSALYNLDVTKTRQ